jgi:hypothetical protein
MSEKVRLAVKAARRAFAAQKAHREACAICQRNQRCQIGQRYEVRWLQAGSRIQ